MCTEYDLRHGWSRLKFLAFVSKKLLLSFENNIMLNKKEIFFWMLVENKSRWMKIGGVFRVNCWYYQTCSISHQLKLMPFISKSCNLCLGLSKMVFNMKVLVGLSDCCTYYYSKYWNMFHLQFLTVKKDFELARRLGGKGRPWWGHQQPEFGIVLKLTAITIFFFFTISL